MPQVLDSNYAIRIVYMRELGRFKLQYRVTNEIGEQVWVTAHVVDDKGEPLGSSVEIILESKTGEPL